MKERRFLRHTFTGLGDGLYLLGLGGVEEKEALGVPAVDGVEGMVAGVAEVFDVFDVGLGGEGGPVDTEEFFEDEFVEDGDVKSSPGIGVVGCETFHGVRLSESGQVEGAVIEVHADDVLAELGLLGHAVERIGETLVLLGGVVVAKPGDVEKLFHASEEGRRGEVGEVFQEAVGGQDEESGIAEVNEGHELPGGGGVVGFLEVIECGFVAVVSVGDEGGLWSEGLDESVDLLVVGEGEEAVLEVVVVAVEEEFGSGAGLGEDMLDGVVGVVVEQEDLSDLASGGAEEVEAVGFGPVEGVFVGANGVAVGFEAAQGDEAGAAEAMALDGEVLGVDVDGVLVVLLEGAVVDEGLQVGPGLGVGVGGGAGLWFGYVGDVIGAALAESLAEFGVDDVVGWCDAVAGVADDGRIVTVCAKRL